MKLAYRGKELTAIACSCNKDHLRLTAAIARRKERFVAAILGGNSELDDKVATLESFGKGYRMFDFATSFTVGVILIEVVVQR